MIILITGADGFLGGKIIREIMQKTDHSIIGLTLSMDRVAQMMDREELSASTRMKFVINSDFLKSDPQCVIDAAIHLAFSRRMQPATDIASSINFAATVFHKLMECHVPKVINMSSQGVYGAVEEIRTENTPPAPNTQYTMAKYAAEVLFDDIMKYCPLHTNLRLDPVAQSQNVLIGLCKSAKEGHIKLKGGKQVFSFIDANDVASAVLAMIHSDEPWQRVYNVGWSNMRYSLIELANYVADAAEKSGYKRPMIELNRDDTMLWAGMDSTLFTEKTGWKPHISIRQTIEDMIRSTE